MASDATVVARARWGAEVAAVNCAKMFGCCDAGEGPRSMYADEAQCRRMLAASAQSNLDEIVTTGLVVYDGKAARMCLDQLTAMGCAATFNHPNVTRDAPSCEHVVRGAVKLGGTCEDLDVICESSNCLGTCGPPRGCPVSCGVGQFCDEGTHACAATKPDASDCFSNFECTPPSVCRMRACGPPLADGTACTANTDCTSGACIATTMTGSACGALLANDAPCFGDEDCASGACLATSAGPLACMAPLPDGSRCASDTQCAGGTCAARADAAPPTCGPLLCDGV